MLRDTWTQRRHLTPGIGLFLFFAGILAGVLFVQMQKDDSFAGIFSEYFLNQYASLPIDYKKLFRYVGGYRCSQYGLMLGLGAFFAAPFFFGGALFLLGMTWGTMISISTVRLGLKGVILCVAGVIPQIFFYIPAFGWMLLWVWKQGNNRKKYLFLGMIGFFFLVFGIVTEVYLNPLILQQILRKM